MNNLPIWVDVPPIENGGFRGGVITSTKNFEPRGWAAHNSETSWNVRRRFSIIHPNDSEYKGAFGTENMPVFNGEKMAKYEGDGIFHGGFSWFM